MSYAIHKLTYSDGRAYRYHISDDTGKLHYIAERTGLLHPSPTRLVEFFDIDQNRSGRLQPPDTPPWVRATRYEVFVGEEATEPSAVILETWRLVDVLLLRMPRYEVHLGEHRYVVRGSRYGERFYEIYRPFPEEEPVEEEPEGSVREGEEEEEEEDQATEADAEHDLELELEEDEEDEEEEEARGIKVGEIQRPTVGPSYLIEAEVAPLRQALLILAATAILIDMQLHP